MRFGPRYRASRSTSAAWVAASAAATRPPELEYSGPPSRSLMTQPAARHTASGAADVVGQVAVGHEGGPTPGSHPGEGQRRGHEPGAQTGLPQAGIGDEAGGPQVGRGCEGRVEVQVDQARPGGGDRGAVAHAVA